MSLCRSLAAFDCGHHPYDFLFWSRLWEYRYFSILNAGCPFVDRREVVRCFYRDSNGTRAVDVGIVLAPRDSPKASGLYPFLESVLALVDQPRLDPQFP
ncbi:MAG: hypothetical protein LW850_06970, partial [Planctomycetaceae bacterium]|nr:hypothetical protein [Planctomycetaceae bacterium]